MDTLAELEASLPVQICFGAAAVGLICFGLSALLSGMQQSVAKQASPSIYRLIALFQKIALVGFLLFFLSGGFVFMHFFMKKWMDY